MYSCVNLCELGSIVVGSILCRQLEMKWGGEKWLCRFSVLGGSENIRESIILDSLPSTRNLDIRIQNVCRYHLESVIESHIDTKYENRPVGIF
jgi:hypothetical protein